MGGAEGAPEAAAGLEVGAAGAADMELHVALETEKDVSGTTEVALPELAEETTWA